MSYLQKTPSGMYPPALWPQKSSKLVKRRLRKWRRRISGMKSFGRERGRDELFYPTRYFGERSINT